MKWIREALAAILSFSGCSSQKAKKDTLSPHCGHFTCECVSEHCFEVHKSTQQGG